MQTFYYWHSSIEGYFQTDTPFVLLGKGEILRSVTLQEYAQAKIKESVQRRARAK